MATLQGIQGSSLVTDISSTLGLVDKFVEQRRKQEAEATRRQEVQTATEGVLGAQTPEARNKAQARLLSLDPKVAEGAQAIMKSGNEKAIADAQKKVETGARRAKLISQGKTFADKQRINRELAAEAQAAGEDITDFLDRANLTEDQFDLDIRKDMIMAQDLKTVLGPAPERFEDVTDAAGNVIAQRNVVSGEVIPDPRAAAVAKPTTTIGKARADFKAGLITESEFNTIKSTPRKAQSKVGKLLEDQRAIIADFGEDSPQAKAMREAIKSEQKGEAVKLSDVGGIRKEFTKLSSDFISLRDAIGKVEQASDTPSAAGDLALIFNFMKILDPGSVVRESEFATAQNAASLPGRLGAAAQRVVNGERMLPEQRKDFVDTASRLFQSQLDKQVQLESSFRDIAERNKINPDDVVIDFISDRKTATVDVNGVPTKIGSIVTNSAGQKGRVESDGSITPIP